MNCPCGFRTFSTIDMAKHRSSCQTWQSKNNVIVDTEKSRIDIPLRHVRPCMAVLDLPEDPEPDSEFDPDPKAADRSKSIAGDMTVAKDEMIVAKVMSS